MQLSRSRLLHDTLRRYLRAEAWGRLDTLVARTRIEELAVVMGSMTERDQGLIFGRLTTSEDRALLIVSMLPPFGNNVLSVLSAEDAAAILTEMAPDDMADILADLDPSFQTQILAILEDSEEVQGLMAYRDDTAGGIMVPEFIALTADTTAEEALIQLREEHDDVEMVYYIYAVNTHGHLVGVLSLRKLVIAASHRRISDIMETDIISVTTDTDQEEVARLVGDYGLIAIPVVDDGNKLVGLVTVDDVIEVIREEANEDFLKMAGAGTELSGEQSVLRHTLVRFPWLLASCAGGLIAAVVMGHYEDVLKSHHFLALFLPVILGMSGNVGTQSATVTVRGIAMGTIRHGERSWVTVRREILISMVLGLSYGVLIGGVSAIYSDETAYALAIGIAIAAGMLIASTIGTVIPILLSRLNIDPAVATGPIVTTSVDFFGVMVYFGLATELTALLGPAL